MEDALIKTLKKKMLEKLDMDELVVAMLPEFKKELQKELIFQIKEGDFADLVYNLLSSKEVVKALSERFVKALK